MQRVHYVKEFKERPVETSVKYRFKSAIEFSTVHFLGTYISVGDLRKEITKQKRLAPNADYELQIMNSETKHVYEFDPTLIPADTNLIVSRIPVVAKKSYQEENTNLATTTSSSFPATATKNATLFSNVSDKAYGYQQSQQNDYQSTTNYGTYYPGYGYYDPATGGYYNNGTNSEYSYDANQGGYNYGNYENNYSEEGYGYHDYEYASAENSNSDATASTDPNPNLQYVPITTSINKPHRYVPYSYSRRTSNENIPTNNDATSVNQVNRETSDESSDNTRETSRPTANVKTSPTGDDSNSDYAIFGINRHKRGGQPGQGPPDSYRCFKCNMPGHWIKHCPRKDPEAPKKSTGIPKSQMVFYSEPVEGAFIAPDGRYAVPVTFLESQRMDKR